MEGRLPVNWLRVFEVAARHLNLTSAAAELNVTPAAVSQQVRLLEQRLGSALFVRHARGLRLTVAGESLLPACRESFERLDTAIGELFGHRQRGPLVVRVALGFAREWLLGRLGAFADVYPDVPLRLVAAVWDSNPLNAGVDLDIRVSKGPVHGLESHRLTHDDVFPVCSPVLRAKLPRALRPHDLARQRLLTTLGFAQGWKQWFAAAGARPDPAARGIEFDSMRLALEMAALGHGIALARTSFAADLLRDGRLRRLTSVRLRATDNVYLTHARGIDPSSPAALLRDWLVATDGRRR